MSPVQARVPERFLDPGGGGGFGNPPFRHPADIDVPAAQGFTGGINQAGRDQDLVRQRQLFPASRRGDANLRPQGHPGLAAEEDDAPLWLNLNKTQALGGYFRGADDWDNEYAIIS